MPAKPTYDPETLAFALGAADRMRNEFMAAFGHCGNVRNAALVLIGVHIGQIIQLADLVQRDDNGRLCDDQGRILPPSPGADAVKAQAMVDLSAALCKFYPAVPSNVSACTRDPRQAN